jgi:hypothetical protein
MARKQKLAEACAETAIHYCDDSKGCCDCNGAWPAETPGVLHPCPGCGDAYLPGVERGNGRLGGVEGGRDDEEHGPNEHALQGAQRAGGHRACQVAISTGHRTAQGGGEVDRRSHSRGLWPPRPDGKARHAACR